MGNTGYINAICGKYREADSKVMEAKAGLGPVYLTIWFLVSQKGCGSGGLAMHFFIPIFGYLGS